MSALLDQTPTLTALKEWSVAVDALAQGETILLLRKGGIKEDNGKFSAEASRVVLFPTYEHQKPELLKPQYQQAVTPVTQGWHPNTITLKAWAEITHIFLTDDADKVAALSAFHIWQPDLAQTRLKWKPKQPLYILLLRAHRFSQPIDITWQTSYSGCRSWISLDERLDLKLEENAAISESSYKAQVREIENTLK